ncbi:MAG TPA: GLPGLI family protein [Puia sp.]|nr:GLPGLI family protein [Puia sp.]
MKIIFITLIIPLLPQILTAQIKEGVIIYESKIDMHRRITDESEKAMVPEFNKSKVQLIFSAQESTFKNLSEEEDVRDNTDPQGNQTVIRMGSPNNETYKNFSSGKCTERRELGPKKYLIEDSLPKQNWKLENETKMILGHNCKKAKTINRDSSKVVAWYTEDIQTPSGPEQYGGLPGMILELDINDAEFVFTALEIKTKDFDKSLVKAPTEGKKITPKEFQKILQDEFGANPNGGPVIRIIRN